MDTSFELIISSDIAEIPKVSARLEQEMHTSGFRDEDILDTQLAIEEVITNVIVHGYENAYGEIIISCRMSSDSIEVDIKDAAPPFDPLSIPEPDLFGTVEDRNVGGLGVYLIRQVMDEVSYQYKDGHNILVLKKRRTI